MKPSDIENPIIIGDPESSDRKMELRIDLNKQAELRSSAELIQDNKWNPGEPA